MLDGYQGKCRYSLKRVREKDSNQQPNRILIEKKEHTFGCAAGRSDLGGKVQGIRP